MPFWRVLVIRVFEAGRHFLTLSRIRVILQTYLGRILLLSLTVLFLTHGVHHLGIVKGISPHWVPFYLCLMIFDGSSLRLYSRILLSLTSRILLSLTICFAFA